MLPVVESTTDPVARTGVRVTFFLTSATARAAAVPIEAPAEVCCSTVSLKKRLPGATYTRLD